MGKDGGDSGKQELKWHYGNTYVNAETKANTLEKGQGVLQNECVGGRQH